mmetsp:Transcript_3342/g.5199  ORF Transcript_3342/g.5199 Transcript_3342/m.5199 type:complete len:319 (+) Transcript_3342:65-1021(+)|eukprot:CAMPEP_0171456800 /NCGR_PEP_ID=MMETSP0945-20130129/3134_1 /TAXON_ID=109269 /ORGANISM="Vaucheria litorea, Strain CCMP2940" /LENGTH=318 /DNA_ID=CAMNT_0011982281 /DNA_START=53 /DNA_END=1012 /DNA_ORIENTATION=+
MKLFEKSLYFLSSIALGFSYMTHFECKGENFNKFDAKSVASGFITGVIIHSYVASGETIEKNELGVVGKIEKLQESFNQSKKDFFQFPFVQKKEVFTPFKVPDSKLETAVNKVKSLNPYLDEVEYLITVRNWSYLTGFLGVFSQFENEFVDLIDGLYLTDDPVYAASRETMQNEAENLFLALDDLNQAAQLKQGKKAEKSYVNIALAYDRFLKAGGLSVPYPYSNKKPFTDIIPDSELVYDSKPPELRDPILILKGPDKGRTGRLIGKIKSRQEVIVKMDYNNEVKLLNAEDIAKQITRKGENIFDSISLAKILKNLQ